MTSVCSASPSGNSFPHAESDSEWEQIESNAASSVGFLPSPSSGSMASWGMVGYPNQVQPSPPAASPLDLNADTTTAPQTGAGVGYAASFPEQHTDPSMMASTSIDEQYLASFDGQQLLASHGMFFQDQFNNNAMDTAQFYSGFQGSITPEDFTALSGVSGVSGVSGLENFEMPSAPVDLGIPRQFRAPNDVSPWAPTNLKNDDSSSGLMSVYDVAPQMPPSQSHQQHLHQQQRHQQQHQQHHTPPPQHLSPSSSSHLSSSPRSPHIKEEHRSSGKAASPIRKIKGPGKVEKRKAEAPGKFVIMTPNLINAQSGKPNPFECFEAMRTTQRGRKGPLANETKESALQVRRLGACFCCHSRKVKCDKERPCKNCKKLTAQVPQIICWQFQDFLPVLFPDFIRAHFKKEAMASFISENVQHFGLGGAGGVGVSEQQQQCAVELFSGTRFQATLTVPATFFTAKTADILRHWHLHTGVNQIDLQSLGSAPLGIDPENAAQREELRRRTREYVASLASEPLYAEQVTDAIRSTTLPCRVLKIVQRYAQRSNSAMVKRALSLYVMHYVMTRQLCLTSTTVARLQQQYGQGGQSWVTTRVLNRQVKSALDELLLRETTALFEGFSKSLKPKLRREWAPCTAAFLVLCLFMEAVETAADTFVVSQNEIGMRDRRAAGAGAAAAPVPEYRREFALNICREIDNLPFKQFAYQFHQTYQTHSVDAAAKAFNPLVDEALLRQRGGDLDDAAVEMVGELQELLKGDNWAELDFLVADPILPNAETHPYPMDVSLNYTGRLLARFLLSFTDEKYLFDGQY